MSYTHEPGSKDFTRTQLADNFEPQSEAALLKRSESQIQKVLERKNSAQDWNVLDEAKSAIVAKKNTIENLNFSVKSQKPTVTSQDLLPVSTEINSLNLSKEQQENTSNISYDHILSVLDTRRKERVEPDPAEDEVFSKTEKKKSFYQSHRLSVQMACGVVLLACCVVGTVKKSNELSGVIQRADDLFVQSKFSQSLGFYDRALSQDQSLIGPRLRRVQIYYLKGDYARALADSEYVLSRFPNDHQALKQCAFLSVLCKKNKRALECAQALLRLQYTEPKDLVVIIKALAANNQHLRANYFYEKFSQVNQDKTLATNLTATIKYSRSKLAQYSYQTGMNELRKASISDPSRRLDYLHYMVDFAAKRKNYRDASNLCSEILGLDSSNSKAALKSELFKYLLISPGGSFTKELNSSTKVRQNAKLSALKAKAFDAFEKGDSSSASDALSQAFQISPQDPELKKFLSYTLMKASLLDKVTAYQNSRQATLDELIGLMRSLHDSHQTNLASKVAAYAVKRYPKEIATNVEFQKIVKEGY